MKYSISTFLLTLICFAGIKAQSKYSSDFPSDSLQTVGLEEVVVTGQFEPQSAKASVFRVRTINRSQLEARGSVTMENILNTQLGIRFSNDLALGETDIELMGMSGQNVKVLIDGIPLLDRGATKQSLSQLDVNLIERIEIVEGPMSVIYGTDALAGVINIITKSAPLGDNMSIYLRLQEESAGNEYNFISNEGVHNGSIGIDWQRQGWNIMLSGTRNNFGGWQGSETGRSLQWDPKTQWMTSAKLGYKNNIMDTWYRLDYTNEDLYSPGALNPNTGRAIDQNFLTNRFTHILNSNWKTGERSQLQTSVSYQEYERATKTMRHNFADGTSELTTGAGEQDVALFSSIMARGTWQYRFNDRLSIQPGIEVLSNSGSGQRIKQDSKVTDAAVFLSAEYKPAHWLNVRPGVRFIHNTVYTAPPVIPSINTKIQISETVDLRSAYARGFRAPALRELYFTFFDSNHAIQGNENLKAEFSNSFNSYLTWRSVNTEHLKLVSTIGAYHNRFSNLITIGYDPADPIVNTYVNINKYRTTGTTLENTLQHENWVASLGFSMIGRYNQLSESESDVASMSWTPEISSNIQYQISKLDASVNLFYKFNGRRPRIEAISQTGGNVGINQAFIEAYHTADLSLTKGITNYLSLQGGVRNLFDITDVRNTALQGDGAHSSGTGSVPLSYGRSFYLGLTIQLKK